MLGRTDLHHLTNVFKSMGFQDWEVSHAHGPTVVRLTGNEKLIDSAIVVLVSGAVGFYFDSQGRFIGNHSP